MATISPTPKGQGAWLELDSGHFYNFVVLLRLYHIIIVVLDLEYRVWAFPFQTWPLLSTANQRAVQDASLTTQMYSQPGFYPFSLLYWFSQLWLESYLDYNQQLCGIMVWSTLLMVFNSVLSLICCLGFWTSKTRQKTSPTISKHHMVTGYSIATSVYTVNAYDQYKCNLFYTFPSIRVDIWIQTCMIWWLKKNQNKSLSSVDLYGKRDMIIFSVWDKLWINPDLIGFSVMHTELGVWVGWALLTQ